MPSEALPQEKGDERAPAAKKQSAEAVSKKSPQARRSNKGKEKSGDKSPSRSSRKAKSKKSSSRGSGSRVGKKTTSETSKAATKEASTHAKSSIVSPPADVEDGCPCGTAGGGSAAEGLNGVEEAPQPTRDEGRTEADTKEEDQSSEAKCDAAEHSEEGKEAGVQEELSREESGGEQPLPADTTCKTSGVAEDGGADSKEEPEEAPAAAEESASAPLQHGTAPGDATAESTAVTEHSDVVEHGETKEDAAESVGDDDTPSQQSQTAEKQMKSFKQDGSSTPSEDEHSHGDNADNAGDERGEGLGKDAEPGAAPVPLPAVVALEASEAKKKKKKKKRRSLIVGLLGTGSSSAAPDQQAPIGTDALDLENALINSGGSMGLGQMKYVGSPKKLQKSVLRKQQQRYNQLDVDLLKSNIVHGWYVDCSCGLRGVNVDDGKKMMQCDVCKAWQHCKCNGLQASTEEQQARLKAKKVWVCQFCKLGRYKYQGHFWKYDRKEEVRKLKEDQALLEANLAKAKQAKKEEKARQEEEPRQEEEADEDCEAEAEPPSISVGPAESAQPAEAPPPAGPAAAVHKPGHGRSRSVEFSRKVVVHRILSVEESEAARKSARDAVLSNTLTVRSILRAEPQEFPEAPPIPSPLDMLEEGVQPPQLTKKSSFGRAISRRLQFK